MTTHELPAPRPQRTRHHQSCRRRVTTAAIIGRFTVSLLLTFAWLAHGQPTISGRVVNAQTGFGIVGIDLDAFDAQGHSVVMTGDITGVEGRYTLALPGAGSYSVRADPSLNDFFVDQYYSNAFLRAEATLITVGPSGAVTNINFNLRGGFQIRGFIRSQGLAVADVDLDLYAANGDFLSGYPARSASDGSFVLGVLPPGNYFLRAQPDIALGQFFVPAFYNGALRMANATAIVVSNADVTGIVLELAPGGAISGRVADRATGSPLPGFDLDLYDTNHVLQPFGALTDANGDYTLGPVPPGRYQLRVDPTIQQAYARTYYTNSFFHSVAQTIEVQAGRITPSIDFALVRAGAVTGRMLDAVSGQPLAGIDVHVYDLATNRFNVFAKSDTNGYYLLGPLPVGSHFIRAYPDPALGHLPQYYNGATNLAGATPVAIVGEMTTSNINFRLGPAGWIEGVVSNTAGVGLAGIDLDVYEATTGERLLAGALTKSNGFYQLGPIPPGQYKLRCDPTISQGYAVEYFNGKLTKAEADVILVNASTGTSKVNFTLDSGGSISGLVLAADSGQPVAAVDIDVLQAGTLLRLDQSTITGADGRFSIGPLPAGTYMVRADPPAASNYLRTYHAGTPDLASAQPVVLSAPGALINVDIQLIAKLPPVILAVPQSQTVAVGSNVTFIVTATGTSPLSYQWFFKNSPLTNAIGSMLVLDEVQLAQAGDYSVVVTNVAGSRTSAVAVLTVIVPPTIQTQPTSLTVAPGQAATFTVRAEGTDPLSYQWRKDGVALPNSNDNTLRIPSVTTNDAGVYTVVVSNSIANVVSAPATLSLTQGPSAPRLVISLVTPSALRISLEAAPGQTYQLEGRQSLTEGVWTASGAAVTNSTGRVDWNLQLDSPMRFYRVQTR